MAPPPTLTLTEEPGDYDVYELNLTTGAYTRAKYRDGIRAAEQVGLLCPTRSA